MKYSILIALMLGAATSTHATTIVNYSWEDDGTVLAVYPDPELPSIIATNVVGKDGHPVHQSLNNPSLFVTQLPWDDPDWPLSLCSLQLVQNDPGGASAAYVAYAWGFNPHFDADVTASVWYYARSPGTPQTIRLWGHWCSGLPDDPYHADGDAGGIELPLVHDEWTALTWSWDCRYHWGIVIEVWLHGAVGDTVWLDDLQLEISVGMGADPIYYQLPGIRTVVVSTEERSWSEVKTLYR